MQQLDYSKIGMRICQSRKQKGWSQEELAKLCGVSMSFIGHIERGTRKMSLETFASICSILHCDAAELLWGAPGYYNSVLETIWSDSSSKADSYAMYVRIMKSVAEIMSEE